MQRDGWGVAVAAWYVVSHLNLTTGCPSSIYVMIMMFLSARSCGRFIHWLMVMMAVTSCVSLKAPSLDERHLSVVLHGVPPWPGGATEDYSAANWSQLISVAKVIQQSNHRSVDVALRRYQSESSGMEGMNDDTKLYILLRIVFQMPEHAKISGVNPMSYCWAPGPSLDHPDGTFNYAWPITWNNGQPRVVAGFEGYEGPDVRYDASAEFDYLKKHYPFRDLSAFKVALGDDGVKYLEDFPDRFASEKELKEKVPAKEWLSCTVAGKQFLISRFLPLQAGRSRERITCWFNDIQSGRVVSVWEIRLSEVGGSKIEFNKDTSVLTLVATGNTSFKGKILGSVNLSTLGP